ncbi:MAG: hypothetical protein AAFQ14_03815, partial [Cyanobacteria bacterium J06621_12]
RFSKPFNRSVVAGISSIFLYGLCWTIFVLGGWLPLIPSGITLFMSGCSLVLIQRIKTARKV